MFFIDLQPFNETIENCEYLNANRRSHTPTIHVDGRKMPSITFSRTVRKSSVRAIIR